MISIDSRFFYALRELPGVRELTVRSFQLGGARAESTAARVSFLPRPSGSRLWERNQRGMWSITIFMAPILTGQMPVAKRSGISGGLGMIRRHRPSSNWSGLSFQLSSSQCAMSGVIEPGAMTELCIFGRSNAYDMLCCPTSFARIRRGLPSLPDLHSSPVAFLHSQNPVVQQARIQRSQRQFMSHFRCHSPNYLW